ncbi:MAG: hypothetical protein DMG05_25655 [Acidobacteria bacterium]|nr:MAG: hypothetical protein DMG05_25655 [Acidobacteriota bacterium]
MKQYATFCVASSLLFFAGTVLADDIKQIHLATKDIVYDSSRQAIYASVPSRAGGIGNAIATINPCSGAILSSVYIGSEPGMLAISDNQQFVYVALEGAASVARFDISSQTVGLQFPLGNGGPSGLRSPKDMAVLPGNPEAIAVAGNGVTIFDNGVPRHVAIPSYAIPDVVIAFSTSSSRLYGLNGPYEFYRMKVDDSGVSIVSSTRDLVTGDDFEFDNGLIYVNSGQVIDPEALQVVGTFSFESFGGVYSFLPDSVVGRVYFLVARNQSSYTILAFDQRTFLLVGSLDVPGVLGTPSKLIRWGANGLAFRTTGDQVFLIQTALIPTDSATKVVPIVLDTGGHGQAHFATELTLANRGSTTASLQLTYTAATSLGAAGSGTVSDPSSGETIDDFGCHCLSARQRACHSEHHPTGGVIAGRFQPSLLLGCSLCGSPDHHTFWLWTGRTLLSRLQLMFDHRVGVSLRSERNGGRPQQPGLSEHWDGSSDQSAGDLIFRAGRG